MPTKLRYWLITEIILPCHLTNNRSCYAHVIIMYLSSTHLYMKYLLHIECTSFTKYGLLQIFHGLLIVWWYQIIHGLEPTMYVMHRIIHLSSKMKYITRCISSFNITYMYTDMYKKTMYLSISVTCCKILIVRLLEKLRCGLRPFSIFVYVTHVGTYRSPIFHHILASTSRGVSLRPKTTKIWKT